MTWEMALSLLALVIGILAFMTALRTRRKLEAFKRERARRRKASSAVATTDTSREPGPTVVVYNPTKVTNFGYLREELAIVAQDASIPEPIWIATTPDDTGTGQTQKALEMGASVVIAAGGDGTVREVAASLVGTGVPLGLLPVGTGNLLARNLDLPLNSARDMAIIALTGRDRPIDVGWMVVPDQQDLVDGDLAEHLKMAADRDDGVARLAKPGEYAFIVIAGMGFDADVMAEADTDLKNRIGWLAYLRAAIPRLLSPKMNARIIAGFAEDSVDTTARSVMFLNCGELTSGIVMDPDARPDDGWLDLAVLDTRGGLIGWADLVRRVGLNGLGMRAKDLGGRTGGFDFHRVREVSVEADTFQQIQCDGDVFGYAKRIGARIDHGALKVRVHS